MPPDRVTVPAQPPAAARTRKQAVTEQLLDASRRVPGNRIGGAKFTLDGVTYLLDQNNGPNHLHGGYKGFDKFVWSAEQVQVPGNDTAGLRLGRLPSVPSEARLIRRRAPVARSAM